jgi:putative transposase
MFPREQSPAGCADRLKTPNFADDGVAERWVESCRRDLLDHVIAAIERHLKRLLSDYVGYYHEDRTHLGLNKETPVGRIQSRDRGAVVFRARLGGLHHRYDRAV